MPGPAFTANSLNIFGAKVLTTVEPSLKRPISSPFSKVIASTPSLGYCHLKMSLPAGGVIVPAHVVSMLATIVAPTKTIASSPNWVSKIATTRSLRAKRSGTFAAVSGLTENNSPGI